MRAPPFRAILTLPIALAALLTACPPGEPHADLGMSDSTFVRTLVRLRRIAEDTMLDSAARDSTRRIVLRDQRVTVAQLDSAARLLRLEPKRADTLWKTIDLEAARRQKRAP